VALSILLGCVQGAQEAGHEVSSIGTLATLILVVGEDHDLRSALIRVLRRAGYRVLDAESAPEALELVRAYREPIDLLLTDISLPLVPGTELAQQLKARQGLLSVLYMSGSPDSQDLGEEAELIEKPFELAALLDRVSSILASSCTPKVGSALSVPE
jgi:DNA-binding response OmpR family regulator